MNGNDLKLANAIVQDINNSAELIDDRKFKSVYFGGGTPSLASVESIKYILDSVKNKGGHGRDQGGLVLFHVQKCIFLRAAKSRNFTIPIRHAA